MTSLLKAIFQIRLGQLWRTFVELGFMPSLFLLLLASGSYTVMLQHPSLLETPQYWCFVQWVFIAGVHTQRNDTRFLKEVTPSPVFLFITEYLTLGLPVGLLLLWNGQWLWGATTFLSAAVAVAPSFRLSEPTGTLRFAWIGPVAFEWHSGWRKQFPNIVLIGVAGIGFGYFHFAVLPLAVLLIGLTCTSFYIESEPLEMLEASGSSPKEILWQKWKTILVEWGKMAVPFFLVQIMLHPFWHEKLSVPIFAGAWAVGLLLLSLALLIKYANYAPHTENRLNSFYIGLALVSLLIPFLVPLPVLFLTRSYRKAVCNLSGYLT